VPTQQDSISNLGALLTKEQLAGLLNVHQRTVNAWMANKTIPFFRIGSRVVRFDPAEVRAALARYHIKEVA
jgi:excisionase family DNA binding protein